MLGDVTVTPFAVDHGPKAPGAVGFVVQHGSRKIVIPGDFLRIVDEENPLLFGADVMFLDANTWHPADWTWHQSVLGNLRVIDKWRPKPAYLAHYSGYEDREHAGDAVDGPMSLARFQDELRRLAGGHEIQPAAHGMFWPKAICHRSLGQRPRSEFRETRFG